MRKTKKTYYCCFVRETEDVLVSFTLQQVADYLQLDRGTVRRYLKNSDKYSNERFIIWKGIEIKQIKRGFALVKR